MPDEFRDTLLIGCDWKYFDPGEHLYSAGDPPGGIFGIISGSVGFDSALGPPDLPMVHIGHRGMWFGESAVLTGQPRRISATAITAVTAAHVPLPTLQAVLTARPEWWQHIGQLSVASLDLVSNCRADLMIRDSSGRCAAILLRLCDCRFSDSDDKDAREIVIRQSELAAMANLSRDSAHNILRDFSSKGWVELRYRSIVVIKTKPLRKLVKV